MNTRSLLTPLPLRGGLFFITDSGCRSLSQSGHDFPFWGWVLLFSDLSRTGRGSTVGWIGDVRYRVMGNHTEWEGMVGK